MKLNIWMTTLVSAALVMALAQCKKGDDHAWGYEGEHGPAHWGGDCKTGQSQSPINLTGAAAGSPGLNLNYTTSPVKILHNGHTVQANLDGKSTLTTGGKEYSLVQFHFHAPSEHTIDGKPADLVAHLVHKSADGALAVVGVLFNEGVENSFLGKFWEHLPAQKSPEHDTGVTVDLNEVLPAVRGHYAYSGSLTTPPCSEGVSWFVMHTPVTISSAQLAAFRKVIDKNVRPVQPLNGRALSKN